MPFQNTYQQTNQPNLPYPQNDFYRTSSGTYHPAHGVGAPTSQWSSTRDATGAIHDERSQPHGNANGHMADQGLPLRAGGPSQYPQGLPSTPRRTTTGGRQPEELHISHSTSAMNDVHHYGAPPAYGGNGLTMNIQPSSPQHPQHPNSSTGNPMPGSLQPGMNARPGQLSSNSASLVPTLPQISTQMQQPPLSARPLTSSHNYSRSSPGNMDQSRYKPYSNTPESQKYASPTASYLPQTPQGATSYSPLGLADIRPRADTGLSDGPLSPGVFSENEAARYPSKSNYLAPWPIYALDWCKWPPRSNDGSIGKVAIGSYLEDSHNYLQILEAQIFQADQDSGHADGGVDFIKTAEATHSYPVTRILWEPPSTNKQTTDLLATSGDHLRLWSLPNDPSASYGNSINRPSTKDQPLLKLSPLALLSNSKSPEHTAPITSLDWNIVSPSLIITSSIDTTCTIWDIPTLTAKTQLIAHDKEVFDVRFCAASVDVFVSCGADGSVRMFDLRSLEHSTIIYEPSDKTDKGGASPPNCPAPGLISRQTDQHSTGQIPNDSSSPTRGVNPFPPPLLRIAASPHDAHLLATFSSDSDLIRVLDVRQPGQALLELRGHKGPVNCIEWSNTQRGVLSSGADDCCVIIWDLMNSSSGATPAHTSGLVSGTPGQGQERGPSAAWECGVEVGNLSWAPVSGCLGVVAGKGLWGVQM